MGPGRGRVSPAVTRARRTPAIRSAERRNDTALTAKKTLTGSTASSAAATAQPPIESALAVALTSPFAAWTFGRSTSAGTSAV